ncbi:MAG: TIGR01777 family oxidoreductase, partial [Pseudobdellovibrionaceae bacterium]
MKILITGATGFIGQELGKALVQKGHEIFALSRDEKKARLQLTYPAHIVQGDLNKGPIEKSKISSIQAVIHLAGENIGDSRWTPDRKEKILKSRTETTEHLMQSLPADLQVFVSASAVGFFGDRGDEVLKETSSVGSGFLAEVCQQWESSVETGLKPFERARSVVFRSGVVLGPYGGALMKMLTPFRMNLGGVLGSGEQWMSWIHLQDMVSLYVKALEDSNMHGTYNAVATEPVTNRQFTEQLVKSLGVRQGPPVPTMALKLLFGEMSSVILDSQKVQSSRLAGFQFRYPDIESALDDCALPYAGGDEVFYAEQFFDIPKSKVFAFFSKAENLEAITPPMMNFKIQSMSTPQIQKGSLIEYRLKIRGVPAGWQTLI